MNVKPRRVLNRLDFSICSRPEVQSGDEIWGTFLQDLATGGLLGRWRSVPTGTERIVPEKVVTTCAVTLQKVPVCRFAVHAFYPSLLTVLTVKTILSRESPF